MELVFDRGTLLLRGAKEKFTHGDFLWDSRVAAYRAPPYRYPTLRQSLLSLGVIDKVPRLQPSPKNIAVLPLRPYQEAALASWQSYGQRGIVVLPTGGGKTHIAMSAIASVGLPTLCLVPTCVLLDQWRTQLATYFQGPIGVLGDGEREIAPITVATFESAYRYMSQLGNQFQLLIVDEVHHFGHGMRDEALEMSTSAFRLGLTATPVTNDLAIPRLRSLIGPTVYELAVSELRGKYLAPFEVLSIQVDLSIEERRMYEDAIEKFRAYYLPFVRACPEAAWIDFIRSAGQSREGRNALAGWHGARKTIHFPRAKRRILSTLIKQHRNSKTLIFTADTATAYSIAKENLIMPITTDIKKAEREDVLESFRSGNLKAIVSCRVLNEGVDVPDAEVAIIVGGTHGEREHIQRIGRCLRPSAGKNAMVYELIARETIEVRHWQKRNRTLAPRIATQV